MDPREVLQQARDAFHTADYARALEKYAWFHENALPHDRALAGVRLSYALRE